MTKTVTIHVSSCLKKKSSTTKWLQGPIQCSLRPFLPLQFWTKRIHLDQLCQTKTKLCGVTHHTGLFLLPCTYTQPPNTELPTGFLLQQSLKQKEGYSADQPVFLPVSSVFCFLPSLKHVSTSQKNISVQNYFWYVLGLSRDAVATLTLRPFSQQTMIY